MGTIALNGITVGYDDAGDGKNALVLVHGHPFDRSMWQPQLDAVSRRGWRVIVPDLRGYGETTVIAGKTTLDVFAQDLAALLDHLGIDRVVIGGLSMGGQIVMEFCRLFHGRVRGVVLAATFPRAETDAGKQTRTATAERLLNEGMASYAEELLPKMVAARTIAEQPTVAAHVMRMMRHAPPVGSAAALRGRAERPPYEDTLAALAVPTLIVVGDEDAFTTRADADQMQALVKGSELVWMEGVGHMPNLEQQSAFNDALAQFLDEVVSR